jgi:peptide/nickel transport system substrate-binding protein
MTRMYWDRVAGRRGSRRWFLGVAGGVGAAGGLTAAGCSGGSGQPVPTRPGNGGDTVPAASPTVQRLSDKHGGTLRYTGYATTDGVYDPHKTQSSAFYGQQALVFSRLLSYQSQVEGKIGADIARAMPEQPDAQTLVFTLKDDVRWHNRAPTDGRKLNSEDVKYSIERQIQGDPSFLRKPQWLNVDAIETPDAKRVVFKLKTPQAMMTAVFADVNSFIVAKEVDDAGRWTPDTQVGSGPFMWADWEEGRFASVRRNPTWHGGNGQPYLDGLSMEQPRSAGEIEGGFRTKRLDVAFLGLPQAQKLKQNLPSLTETTFGQSRFFGMRFFSPQFPYNDQNFRSAVSFALDRRQMIAEWFGGSGDVNGWVSWPITRWALPQAELAALPGYRPGAAGRDQDIKEARARLAAFASSKTVPDELALFVPEDTERTLGMGALISGQLKQALNLNVKVYPFPLGDLVNRMLTGNAPWVAGPDDGWTDLDEWVYPYFHSEGTKNSFALRDTEMDALIASQRVELNEGRRREIGLNIQRKLLDLNVGLNFVSERVVAMSWPYVKNFPLDASDGYQHLFADCWIDEKDPSYRGRVGT